MSIFLELYMQHCIAENDLAFAIRDKFPVTEGHILIIPKREIVTWFQATRDEQIAILDLIDKMKANLDKSLKPAGYNIGFNSGEAAGQTIMHLHVHLIPRHHGDVDNPAGGVRYVIPERGNYKIPGFIPKVDSDSQNRIISTTVSSRGTCRRARSRSRYQLRLSIDADTCNRISQSQHPVRKKKKTKQSKASKQEKQEKTRKHLSRYL